MQFPFKEHFLIGSIQEPIDIITIRYGIQEPIDIITIRYGIQEPIDIITIRYGIQEPIDICITIRYVIIDVFRNL